MSDGLKNKYVLTKADGTPVDGQGNYFVLKLNSDDAAHRRASIAAARAYAAEIRDVLPQLADDLEQQCKISSIRRLAYQDSRKTKLSKDEAINIIVRLTNRDGGFDDWWVDMMDDMGLYDESSDTWPSLYDVLGALGVTEHECKEANI